MPEEKETNAWNKVLGPFYSRQYLKRAGVRSTKDLIWLPTLETEVIYPHAQFDRQPDDSLQPKEPVIKLYNELFRPAIAEGIIDPYMAAEAMLYGGKEQLSKADIIMQDETQIERVAQDISRMLSRFRQ